MDRSATVCSRLALQSRTADDFLPTDPRDLLHQFVVCFTTTVTADALARDVTVLGGMQSCWVVVCVRGWVWVCRYTLCTLYRSVCARLGFEPELRSRAGVAALVTASSQGYS